MKILISSFAFGNLLLFLLVNHIEMLFVHALLVTERDEPARPGLKYTTSACRSSRKKTELRIDILGGNVNNNKKDPLTFGGREPEVEDVVVIFLPAVLTGLAFGLYEETTAAFHDFVEFASHNTWEAVDGGAYLSDLLGPALNGPVTTFISLLFGSLTSMTINNLYNRQATISQTFAVLVEDIRLADIHFGHFPDHYAFRSKKFLRSYALTLLDTFEQERSVEQLQFHRRIRRFDTEQLMRLLHELSSDSDAKVDGRILDQAYDTLNRIIDSRVRMAATYDQQFPLWHYGNLGILASSICTIFFVLTDRSALIFLGAFQLRLCWSLLVFTISILGCVLYDLNTPLTGVFQVAQQSDKDYLKSFCMGESEMDLSTRRTQENPNQEL